MQNNIDSDLNKVEKNFNNKISDLVLPTIESKELLLPNKDNILQNQIKSDIQVDVKELSHVAKSLIEKNEKMSDQEIAIELLKNIAKNNKSKTMRKLASKMIKEKWWDK